MRYLTYDEEMAETEADHWQDMREELAEQNRTIRHELDATNYPPYGQEDE